jgi:hypothetical protein
MPLHLLGGIRHLAGRQEIGAALNGVAPEDAGAASGLVSAMQQLARAGRADDRVRHGKHQRPPGTSGLVRALGRAPVHHLLPRVHRADGHWRDLSSLQPGNGRPRAANIRQRTQVRSTPRTEHCFHRRSGGGVLLIRDLRTVLLRGLTHRSQRATRELPLHLRTGRFPRSWRVRPRPNVVPETGRRPDARPRPHRCTRRGNLSGGGVRAEI